MQDPKPFYLCVQSSISSIDITQLPEQELVIAGGKDCLKLIGVDFQKPKPLEIKLNLRRQGNKISVSYLEFNKERPSYFLAASMQGSFGVWDISQHGSLLTESKQHNSAINKMNWQPNSQNCLISAGQDQIINLFDIRESPVKCTQITRLTSAVRDVKFNPFYPLYFVAATDAGHIELFDIRKSNYSVNKKPGAHSSSIQSIDWNKKHPNILASGSNDNDIKIWQVSTQHEDMDEKIKIKHIQGISDIKFHSKNSNLISASCLNRERSVSIFDLRQPYRPQTIAKGHRDLISSFVYTQNENQIITASKDDVGIMQIQSVASCWKLYNTCPRFPITSNQNDEFIYKLEAPQGEDLQNHIPISSSSCRISMDMKEDNEDSFSSTQRHNQILSYPEVKFKLYIFDKQLNKLVSLNQLSPPIRSRQATQPITNNELAQSNRSRIPSPSSGTFAKSETSINFQVQQIQESYFQSLNNTWNSRPVTYVKNIEQLINSKTQKLTLEQEIKFLYMNYKNSLSKYDNFTHNQEIAKQVNKEEVSFYWIALKKLLQDYETLSKQIHPTVLAKIFDLKDDKPKDKEESQEGDSATQSSPISDYNLDKQPQSEIFKSNDKLNLQPQKNMINNGHDFLKSLYKYFEQNPNILRQEIEENNIILSDNQIRIRKDKIEFYKQIIFNQSPLQSMIDNEIMLEVLIKSAQDLIQKVIDMGELQSGYWMLNLVQNIIPIKNSLITFWTQSYLELLLNFSFFSFTVKVAQDCPLPQIRNSNKFKMYHLCGVCNKEQPCNCKALTLCSLCLLPVKGLMVWCQICLHVGHAQEYREWFKKNNECPSGCGHKCFIS